MKQKKRINVLLVIFLALGLVLSPFTVKHSFSAAKAGESLVSHCVEMLQLNASENTLSHAHKSSDERQHQQAKKTYSCCVAACPAIITPVIDVCICRTELKSALVVSFETIRVSHKSEGFSRPPKSLS